MALPLAPFERILKESEKHIRVSDAATQEFVDVIEELSKELAREIAGLARHAGRRTIKAEDVRMAMKRRRPL